jgi:hypothetical protein
MTIMDYDDKRMCVCVLITCVKSILHIKESERKGKRESRSESED